jgi:putative alpha-1,2-mannosidase
MINAPLVEQYTIQLENGKLFTVRAKKFSEKNCYIKSIKLNNKPYTKSTIEHKTILEGGVMELEMTDKPVNFGKLL